MRCAIFGISSEMWMPGMVVGMVAYGPPVGTTGFWIPGFQLAGAAGKPEQNDAASGFSELQVEGVFVESVNRTTGAK